VSDRLDDFRHRYAAALDAYLQSPGEEGLNAGYELGRAAVAEELGLLDLAAVHQAALAAALDASDPVPTVAAAGDFFLESLSALEMFQRILRDSRERAILERKHAEMLRRLSTFLADASVALDATGSLEEILQLAAEHARELVGAERCSARIALADGTAVDAHAAAAPGPELAPDRPADLAAPLSALDGRELGVIQAFDKQEGDFSELDEAVLVQLAQMAAAAVERAQLYERKSPA
jgi:Phosphoserine phosphatase RsbU, N-terminal domain/GAF domain